MKRRARAYVSRSLSSSSAPSAPSAPRFAMSSSTPPRWFRSNSIFLIHVSKSPMPRRRSSKPSTMRTHSPVTCANFLRLGAQRPRLPVDLLLLLEHVRHAAVHGVDQGLGQAAHRGDRGAAGRVCRHRAEGCGTVRDESRRGRGDARCGRDSTRGGSGTVRARTCILLQPGLFRRVLLQHSLEHPRVPARAGVARPSNAHRRRRGAGRRDWMYTRDSV